MLKSSPRALVALAVVALAGCGGAGTSGASGSDVAKIRKKLIAGITETGEISADQAGCIADEAIDTFDSATLELLASDAEDATPELLDEKAGAGTSDKLIEITSGCLFGEAAGESPDALDESTAPTATDASATTEAPAPSGPGSSLDNPVPLGATADSGGGWTFSFAEFLPDAGPAIIAANEYNEAAPTGQQYVMVAVNAAYNGPDDKSSAFLGPSLKAVGPSKKSYAQYDCYAALPDQLDATADVFAGSSIAGNVCFIVDSADAAELTLYTEGFDDNFDQLLVYFATS